MYLLTFAAGTVVALENPARRALVTDLVAEPDVPNAVGLNSTMMTTSRVIGPALGGALIAGPGIGWCFAANAISYVPQLWLFLRIDRSNASDPRPWWRRPKGQLREGLRYVWSQPDLRLPLLLVTAVGTMAFNFSVILPLFATRDLGRLGHHLHHDDVDHEPRLGARCAHHRAAHDSRHRVPRSLHAGAGGLDGGPRLAPGTITAYLAVVPVGITSVMVISGSNAVVQLSTDPAMRGRVLALLAVVFLGSTPIGGPSPAGSPRRFGARWAIALGAVTSLAAGLLTLRALHGYQGRRGQAPRQARLESVPLVAPGR